MKKILLLITCCILVALAGCGDEKEKVINGNNGEITEVPQNNNQNNDDKQQETPKKNGYVFTFDGVEVSVDADAAGYIAKLGEPASYYETPSGAFDNLDKFYTYHGFEIDTYYSNGNDLVLNVVLLDDTVSTTEGVSIGDKQEKVASVYGEPTEKNETSATYKKDNMKLVFIFKDGVIAAIEYKSLVLDAQ